MSNEGAKEGGNSINIEQDVVARCRLLGITNPYEMAIFSVLNKKEGLIGSTGSVLRDALTLVDPEGKNENFKKLEQATERLVSKHFLKIVERPLNQLYSLNKDFWTITLHIAPYKLLEIYRLFYECNCVAFNLDVFVRELKTRLKNKHGISLSDESIHNDIKKLSMENTLNSIRLIAQTKGGSDIVRVAWNGTLEVLEERIKLLSNSILDSEDHEESEKRLAVVQNRQKINDSEEMSKTKIDELEEFSTEEDTDIEEKISDGGFVELLGKKYEKTVSEVIANTKFTDYMNPLIEALHASRGTLTPKEAFEYIAHKMELSEEVLNEVIESGISKFENQVSWARFYLAKYGYVASPSHGIWSLTEKGKQILTLTEQDINHIVKEVQAQSKKRIEEDNNIIDIQRTNRHSIFKIPVLPEPVDADFGKYNNNDSEEDLVPQDEETINLIDTLTNKETDTKHDDKSKGLETDVDVLTELKSKLDNVKDLRTEQIFNTIKITVDLKPEPLLFEVEFKPENKIIIIRSYMKIINRNPIPLLELAGKDSFGSVIGITTYKDQKVYVAHKTVSQQLFSLNQIKDIVMQYLNELISVYETIKMQKT